GKVIRDYNSGLLTADQRDTALGKLNQEQSSKSYNAQIVKDVVARLESHGVPKAKIEQIQNAMELGYFSKPGWQMTQDPNTGLPSMT
ncbi:hypothetical protein ACI3PL_25060, partial [Lacticaseibacillus paracasei]